MNQIKGVFPYLIKYKMYLIGGIIFVIISNVFGILPPQIIRYSINLISESLMLYKLFSSSNATDMVYTAIIGYLLLFGGLVLLTSILKGLFMFFMRQTIIVMSRKVEFDQKNDLFKHYQKLTLGFFRRSNTGDLMARISEDVGKVRMFVGPGLMYGINLIALFSLVIYAMVQVNLRLTLIVLIPLPLLSMGIYYVNNLILKRSTAIQQQLSTLTTFSQEAFSGIRVLKSFGREPQIITQFNEALNQFKSKQLSLVKADALFYPITVSLIGLSTILAVYQGGVEVVRGSITTGNIAEFVIYVNMLTWPVTSVGWVASIYQQASASQKRIDEIINEKPDFSTEVGQSILKVDELIFKNVSFTYAESGINALKDISFTLKKGQTIGIVGKTGSGKSTIAQLICRMYDVKDGSIYVNQLPISAYHLGNLRDKIGYVPQDVFLFSDTIQANLILGAAKATAAEIKNALEMAALNETIEGFENGLQTILGERGVTLSGGQKQRLAIARALIRQPDLFIFDDCLSTLDTITEKRIIGNLGQVTKKTSTIIISHRIKSVMDANLILVLENGQIVAQGTHQELMLQKGYYSDTYRMQLTDEKPNLDK